MFPPEILWEYSPNDKCAPVKEPKSVPSILFESEQESEEIQDGRDDERVSVIPSGEFFHRIIRQELSAKYWFLMTLERYLSRASIIIRLHSFLI